MIAHWYCPKCGTRGRVRMWWSLYELWDRFARAHCRAAPACNLDDPLLLIWEEANV